MRNYIFIRNVQAASLIEERFLEHTSSVLEISKNRKGKVITFKNSFWVHRMRDFIEEERNMIAFDLSVLALPDNEKETNTRLVQSLDRIARELSVMSHEFRVRGDVQTD